MNSEIQPQQPKRGSTVKIVAGAFLLAAAAGLYALFGGSGKPGQQVAESSCTIADTLRTALDDAAQGHVAAFRVVDESRSLADLSFKDENGQQKTIADWSGKTVLLNLWATWCAPCRHEMPALDSLEAQLGGDSFQVVPVSIDLGSIDKPKGFYQQIELKNLPLFHDGTSEVFNSLKKQSLAIGLPATLLIDKNGCALGTLNGPAEWGGDDAQKLVTAAMAN